jgi:hypothetical protein
MNYYSYLVEHDFGLAPNPFGGYCTLTVCKPTIRKSGRLQIGDWIIGTGSKALSKTFGKNFKYHLIYAMQVAEIMLIEDYWNDNRFKCKRPILNGSLPLIYGDNFYHKDDVGNWIQENSAHSYFDGSPNLKHLKTDISGKHAIVSQRFFYFGQSAPLLPLNLQKVCHGGRGQKLLKPEQGAEFVSWLTAQFLPKIHGKPINWIIYNQQRLF